MYRSTLLGIMLALSTCISTALAQGQVYLFGQLVSSTASVKMIEVTRLKAETPLISFNTRSNPKVNGRMVAYNNATRIQLSSITNNKYHRHLSAAITAGSVPQGSTLKLAVNTPNSNFDGESGISKSEILLNKTDNIIISEIGTCNSGKKPNDGYGLEYTFTSSSQFQNSKVANNKLTVTITIASEV